MGGGGGGGPPPRPKGFDDPWVPNARYEFGRTGENAYPQEQYYEKGGPYWPRGGVDQDGNFVEGQYSYNPVGRYNRTLMDFIKSGATVAPGPTGQSDWQAAIGARPEPAQPRPELMPGGYPLQHPATALQKYGGIQGGFSSGSGTGSGGGFQYGETPAPWFRVKDYQDAGQIAPGWTSNDWLKENVGGPTWGNGYMGLQAGTNQSLLMYPGVAERHRDGTIRVHGPHGKVLMEGDDL